MILTNLNKLNLSSILFFFLCIIPFALIWSRFIADFLVVLICFIFLVKQILEKKLFLNNVFFKFFLLFWILISVRSLFSEDIYFSLKSSLPFIRFAIFALAIQYLIQNNFKRIFILLIVLTPLLLIVAADGLFQHFVGVNILGYPLPSLQGRLSGFFKDELIIGSYIARFMPILMGLYFFCKYLKFISQKNDYYFLLIFSFLFFLVLASGERVSNIYSAISYFCLVYLINIKRANKVIIIICIVFVVSFIFVKSDRIKNRLIIDTLESTNLLIQSPLYEKKLLMFSIQHHSHIVAAYKIFKENILFGSGTKMFRKICNKRYNINEYSCTTHPHNLIMQFLSETGILGFLFYILCLFYILSELFKILKISNLINDYHRSQFFFLIALLISLFPILPSGNFFNNWIGIISFFSTGFYLATLKRKALDV
jgi:O-antigen ligase